METIIIIQVNPNNFQLFVGTVLYAIGESAQCTIEKAIEVAENHLAKDIVLVLRAGHVTILVLNNPPATNHWSAWLQRVGNKV